MFVILTSRPGQYRTEPGPGLRLCESYDYLFCGQNKARFDIAELLHDVKVRVVDETPPERVNDIPSKFLPKFASLEEARAELRSLVRFGMVDAALRRVP
ncbi:MAG TPA: ferredoxin [Acetobacteraceae bacterium]|jgi:hypothetical protein|nr:ferredoxin [Acetobacteraceae bacterium]